MKKVLALLITVFMLFGTFEVSSSADVKQHVDGDERTISRMTFGNGPVHINLWSFSTEVPGMIQYYISKNPEFGRKYTVIASVAPTDGGFYQGSLDYALSSNDADMYVAEQAFVAKYASGDMSGYAASYYDLGIETDDKINDAKIAQYVVDIGTRQSDGSVVALAYQSSGCALIYRASIAKEVFGTDDPDVIEKEVGGGSGNLDYFCSAAIKLNEKGYPIVSSIDDIWRMLEYNTSYGWVSGNTVKVSPERLAYFDYAKALKERCWSNETSQWSTGWYRDMEGVSQEDKTNKPAFCFIGPAWMIQFVMKGYSGGKAPGQGSYGDWRVCQAPQKSFWGGSWIFAGKKASLDADKRAGMAELINWITLDTSKSGLQYLWANGLYSGTSNAKDSVASGKVMANSDGSLDFLGGQNMYPTYIKANEASGGKNITAYDESVNSLFKDQVYRYAFDGITYEEAIAAFKDSIAKETAFSGVEVAERPTVVIPDTAKDIVPGGGSDKVPDKNPDEAEKQAGNKLLIIIICIAAGSVLVIAGLIVTIILIVKSGKKKKANALNAPQYPAQPAIPAQPQQIQQPQPIQQPLQYQAAPAQLQQPVQPAAPAIPAAPAPQAVQQPVIPAPAAPASPKFFCPFCGAEQNSGENFCGRCGSKLK